LNYVWSKNFQDVKEPEYSRHRYIGDTLSDHRVHCIVEWGGKSEDYFLSTSFLPTPISV
jgi:hypothetical protein